MIPEKTAYAVEGQLTGEEIPMGLDPAGYAHIMELLSNAYSDDILAFIREYSTNAWDAHVEAGVTSRPIEVTLPTELRPHFKVKDYGLGLDEEDVRNVYALYGASTKRASNDLNGALGIGCKSAFAYTSQFIVTAVKDGKSITIVIAKDEEKGGVMTVLNRFDTDEPNSVEVSVPVDESDVQEVENTARQFYRAWELGTVKVNGEYPEPFHGLRITEDMMVVEDEDKHIVIMGNVPYPVSLHVDDLNYRQKLVVKVNIGDVVMANSREALRVNNPKTQAKLEEIATTYREKRAEAVQHAIDQAPDKWEALSIMLKWQHIVKGSKFTYQNDEIPQKYYHEPPPEQLDEKGNALPLPDNRFTISNSGSSKLSAHDRNRTIGVAQWDKSIFVTGYDRPTFTATQKKKLNKWAIENGFEDEYGEPKNDLYVLFREDTIPAIIQEWTDSSRYVTWAEVDALKIPRSGGRTATGRKSGSYQGYVDGSWTTEIMADEIDVNEPIFWTDDEGSSDRWNPVLKNWMDKFTIVVLPQNRQAKFFRMFPQSRRPSDFLKEEYKAWAKKLSKKQKIAFTINEGWNLRREYRNLNPAQVDDPAIRRWIRAARLDINELLKERERFNKVASSVKITSEKDPLERWYPLFDHNVFEQNPEHCYTYLNSAYAARKESK